MDRKKTLLDNAPFIQVALDIPDWDTQEIVLKALPKSENNDKAIKIIIEAGTPFVKRYGIDIVKKLRSFYPQNLILADLKTLDVGAIEVDFTADAGADMVVVSGLANILSIDKFLAQAEKRDVLSVIDLMEVKNPLDKLKKLTYKPDVIIFHRGIDTESGDSDPKSRWKLIPEIKEYYKSLTPEHTVLLAVAGGINDKTAKEAIEMGTDILIIGRYITTAENIAENTQKLLDLL